MIIRSLLLTALYSIALCTMTEAHTRSITITTPHNKTFTIKTWTPLDLKYSDAAREGFDAIIAQGGNVIVDFYADWCNPCKMMMKTFDIVAKDETMPDILILKIDTDDSKLNSIIRRFSFRGIPALFFFKDGKQVKMQSGALQPDAFKALIRQLYA